MTNNFESLREKGERNLEKERERTRRIFEEQWTRCMEGERGRLRSGKYMQTERGAMH